MPSAKPSFREFADTVKQTAAGRWPTILQGLGVESKALDGKHHACPGCGGADRFQFTTRGPCADWGRWSCRGHHAGGGDGFALVQHVLGIGFADAVRAVAALLGIGDSSYTPPPLQTPPAALADDSARLARVLAVVQRLWQEAGEITPDDAAGRYLAARGLLAAAPFNGDSLRHHPRMQYIADDGGLSYHPALLAAIHGTDGQLVGLHRIYLGSDGRKADVDAQKKLLKSGELAGAAVRLAPITGQRLMVAEGVETALACITLFAAPCWAAISSWGMQHMVLPAAAREVFIMADNDAAGIKAAHALKDRLRSEGRAAKVVLAEPPANWTGKGFDWLDHLNRLQAEGATHDHA